MLRSFRYWLLALCCVLLSAAHAQEVEPPADKAPATDAAAETHAAAADDDEDQPEVRDDETQATPPTTESDHQERRSHKQSHRHNDDVVGVGYSVELPAGQHASDVVAVFGSATSAGDVSDSVVSVFGHTHVTGQVGDSAVAVIGSVYVNGTVGQDVVAVLGNVELGPEARVRGDVVVVGGVLTRDPSAKVEGRVQTVLGGDGRNFGWLRTWIERCLLYGRPLAFASGLGWAWTVALGLLALYVVLALIFSRGVERCVATLETQPGQSVLAALITLLLTPVTFVLLCVTVLGILAIPFLGLALLCAVVFGKVVVLATIGRRCTPFLAGNPQQHTVMGVLVGGLIVLVLYTIPVIGFILWKVIEILGLGVVVYTILLAVRAGRAAHRGGGGQPPGGGGGMYPGAAAAGWANAGSGGGVGSPGAGAGVDGVGSPGMPGSDFGTVSPGAMGGFEGAGSGGMAGGVAGGGSGGMADGVTGGGPGGMADGVAGGGPGGMADGVAGGGPGGMAGGVAGGPAGSAAAGGSPGAGPASGPFAAASDTGASAAGWAAGGPAASGRGAAPGASVGSTSSGSGPAAPGHPPYINPLSLPRAGFWIRMGALLLDAVIVGIVVHQVSRGFDFNLIVLATYGAVMWKLKSATVGGIICGLQVVRLDGRPIDWPTAVVRALGCFLSLAVVGLGFLWIVIDENRQSWHDKIAGTVVVRSPKSVSLL